MRFLANGTKNESNGKGQPEYGIGRKISVHGNSATVKRGIGNFRGGKTFRTQTTGITDTAGMTKFIGLIAGNGQTVIDTQRGTGANDFSLGKMDQRCVNRQLLSFDTCPRCQIGHRLEGGEIFRAAIRVTGIIDCIDADKNIAAAQHFGPGQSQ